MATEISRVNVDKLRLKISVYFHEEEEPINDEVEKHLTKIEDCVKPNGVLNYFCRHNFIGYFNYSLIKVFQKVAESKLLAKRIEEYEKDYQCFLELSLKDIHDVFQQCPDLRPDYPAGIPKFTIELQSEWEGESMFQLREFLRRYFNSECIDQLMIVNIIKSCIILTFAVLPHIAKTMLQHLTDKNILRILKEEGISVDISPQLLKYLPQNNPSRDDSTTEVYALLMLIRAIE